MAWRRALKPWCGCSATGNPSELGAAFCQYVWVIVIFDSAFCQEEQRVAVPLTLPERELDL